jgi:hypothetical protein
MDNGFNGSLRRARTVGVLNPQQKFAVMMPRKKPVEQSRARAANVEEAGGGWGEAGYYHNSCQFSVVSYQIEQPKEP